MPAGPSEVAVIADHTARPEFIAADLLSQAEHGKDSQVVLFITDQHLNEAVLNEIHRQVELLPRKEFALSSLANSKSFVVDNLATAIEMSNAYAPEHLIIATENARAVSDKIINAGSVFVGHYTPESAGDYASGTNHTLPTNGSARAYSGVSLDSFVKKITFQEISEEGIDELGETIEVMAEAELLQAHSNAVKVRRTKK
jgi:histidinol dehydrogenase